MIVGVGIDVVDIARFGAALERTPGLLTRLFTEAERPLAVRSLAARFAAKEALAKALGAPPGLLWTDAEIRRAADGRPSLHVRGTIAAVAEDRGVSRWHVSLSHDGGIATAFLIAEAANT
ncbi:holo-ACP synthase [Thermomonospora umbrina]|uniref:Holo-[acyl-carrier-protein] synthase n=1 Tax=Thermomonospora umbrina TaxID=111806 RepID=A0A3D9SQC7_9ACTN|nr:holo-ACP synthase [Thermomonospora umbrina]REE98176.1 holo-[acyl-carrier protein] synthase [Thermomonospora umbrina]